MRILIIEDDKIKAQDIIRCLKEHHSDVVIDIAASYASGVRQAFREKYDVVIIDNSLPYYENDPDNIQPDMARVILEECEDLEIHSKSIICSAFEQVEKEEYFKNILSSFKNCLGVVRYDCTENVWKEQLLNLIEKL